MMSSESDLKLPKSLAALGTDMFVDVLREELLDDPYCLPLETMCSHGGMPDNETLELEVLTPTENNGTIRVVVECSFTEAVSTGCADISYNESGIGRFEVIFDAKAERVYIESDY